MNTDYNNSLQPADLSNTIANLRASLVASKEKTNSFDETSYKELLRKYEEALVVIETLKMQVEEVEKKKLPTKDEVESISAMLDLFSKLDPDTINKIERLGGKK